MKNKLTYFATLVALMLSVGCGKPETGNSGQEGAQNEDLERDAGTEAGDEQGYTNGSDVIRLKDRGLIVKSLVSFLGHGFDKDLNNTEISIFDTYGTQFGDSTGLSFGETFSDTKTETQKQNGYFLALNILADNAGKHCQLKLENSKDSGVDHAKCQCETKGQAKDMLQRAFTFMNFEDDKYNDHVKNLAKLCRDSRKEAVTAVISSLLFAIRN